MTVAASIDIGTNSTRLLIAKKENSQLQPLRMEEQITRLGEDIGKLGYLKTEALDRVTEALNKYMRFIKEYKAETVHIVATSAAREASNQELLLERIKAATSYNCRIISGKEEARLTFLGVMSGIITSSKILICDIGGGSTELTFADQGMLLNQISLPIGSRRFKETFLHHDPVMDSEIKAFNSHAEAVLSQHLWFQRDNSVQCIMVGGTATTLAMIDSGTVLFDENIVHHYLLSHSSTVKIIKKLSSMSGEERKHVVGLHPNRADVILAGALITEVILRLFGFSSCQISVRDLLFGLLV